MSVINSMTDEQKEVMERQVSQARQKAYRKGLTEAPLFNWRGVRPPGPTLITLARVLIAVPLSPLLLLIAPGFLLKELIALAFDSMEFVVEGKVEDPWSYTTNFISCQILKQERIAHQDY